MTLTHYIYNISFVETPKFNYAAALSVFILVVVAVLSAIQMKWVTSVSKPKLYLSHAVLILASFFVGFSAVLYDLRCN